MERAKIFHGEFLHQSINDPAEELLGRGSEYNVVHIEQQVNSLCTATVNKKRGI
jgi:hypothetical protein